MNPRKRRELMWTMGYIFIAIACSLYALLVVSMQSAVNVVIVAVAILLICMGCFFIKSLQYYTEQKILTVATVFFIVLQGFIVHSFTLLPICIVAVGIYFLPIVHWKTIRLYSVLCTGVLITNVVMTIIDPTYLSRMEKTTFYLSGAFVLACLISFVIIAKAEDDYSKKLEEQTKNAIEANKSKSTFLANMSHEIRTPMNAILGMSELLLLEDMNDTQIEYLNTIHNSSKSLFNIINDILDFSKIDAGRLELIEERYDFESMTQDVSNLIDARLKDKRVSFTVVMDPNLPSAFMGDEVRIKQILINVLGNSCKHTNRGYISLDVHSKDIGDGRAELTFVMKDTGTGIPKNDLEHIFDAFNQADTKRNRHIEGTGLGLAITKKLAEAMGGSILIESDYGLGTTVTIKIVQKVIDQKPFVKLTNPEKYRVYLLESDQYYRDAFIRIFNNLKLRSTVLKRVEDAESVEDLESSYVFYNYGSYYENLKEYKSKFRAARFIGIVRLLDVVPEEVQRREMLMHSFSISKLLAIMEDRVVAPKAEDNKVKPFRAPDIKVLVVDDNPLNLKVAASMMKLFELNVSFAGSGMDCLKLLEQGNKYDIIFMDHMMPQMDGIETTHRIREREKGTYEHNVIIALTANAIKGVEKMFVDEGMDDYIFKPMDLASLEAILRKWIDPKKQFEKE